MQQDHCSRITVKITVATDRSINFYFDEAWATSGNTGVIRNGGTQAMQDCQPLIMELLKHINSP